MGNKLFRLNTAERLQFFINTGFYFSMQIRANITCMPRMKSTNTGPSTNASTGSSSACVA